MPKGIKGFIKGNKLGVKFQRGQIPFLGMLGKKMSEESKEKMRSAKRKNPTKYWLGKEFSQEHRNKISLANKGKKMSSEYLKNLSQRMIRLHAEGNIKFGFPKGHKINVGKKYSPERIERIKQALKGRTSPRKGIQLPEELKNRIKNSCRESAFRVYDRILKEIPELEKQGFKCIPIGKVIPDIIAIKDNKIFAVEVEYGKPNYGKYTTEIQRYYDDIIWILRK